MSIKDYDDNLFAIFKDLRTLPAFIDVILGFLSRRTDFYCIAENKDSGIGLLPGEAEKMLKQKFDKWLNEKEGTSTPKSRVMDFTKPDCYNGAEYEKYSWSQTLGDVDVIVDIPKNITAKQLSVDIQTKRICAKIKSTGEIIIEGDLNLKIKSSESIWSTDKQKLLIHLEKGSNIWWDCLIIGEERLDISKMDCTRAFADLSEAAQAKIEELAWTQKRKLLGVSSSEQIDLENKLKEAQEVEGYPFSVPSDPKLVVMK